MKGEFSNGMKILMVSSFLPYPLTSGGHIRLYNLIKNLSNRHNITLICEKRDYQTEEDVDEIKKICTKVITVRRKKQWSVSNILKTDNLALPRFSGVNMPLLQSANTLSSKYLIPEY